MKLSFVFWAFGLILLVSNLAFAGSSLKDTLRTEVIINTSISNTSIDFPIVDIFYDQIIIESNSVTFYNLSYINGNLTFNNSDSINHTSVNTHINSSVFPYLSSDQANRKIISSQFSSAVNGTITIPITSPKLCSQLKQVSYSSHTGLYTNTYISIDYTCEGNQLTLTINGIEPATGSNILTLGYLGDSVCDAWEDGFSIDCNPASSPGGGGGGGPIANNTIIETAKETINKIENITKLTANQLLIILLVSIIGFSLLYKYLDESRTNKRRKKINLQI